MRTVLRYHVSKGIVDFGPRNIERSAACAQCPEIVSQQSLKSEIHSFGSRKQVMPPLKPTGSNLMFFCIEEHQVFSG